MTREQCQTAWVKIVELASLDYSKLTRYQRIWFSIEPLTTDGLWDHYMNHGADRNSDTIEDLEFLNFKSIAEKLRNFNNIYFPNGVPKGSEAREEIFSNYSEEKLERDINELEEDFWETCNDLEAALLEHINNTGIGNTKLR